MGNLFQIIGVGMKKKQADCLSHGKGMPAHIVGQLAGGGAFFPRRVTNGQRGSGAWGRKKQKVVKRIGLNFWEGLARFQVVRGKKK